MKKIDQKAMGSVILKFIILLVGILAILRSIGVLGEKASSHSKYFYIYFTNLSNYACILYIFVELIVIIIKRKSLTILPSGKFVFTVGITLTFLVSHTILGNVLGYIGQKKYGTNLTNPLLHLAIPVLFVIDYFVFSREKISGKLPLWSFLYPLAFLVFTYIRVAIIKANGTFVPRDVLFPYSFMDFDNNPGWKVVLYDLGVGAIELAIAYAYYGIITAMDRK